MTSNAESLAEAIMKLAEDDRGLVKSRLVELIERHDGPGRRETLMGLANQFEAERSRIEANRARQAGKRLAETNRELASDLAELSRGSPCQMCGQHHGDLKVINWNRTLYVDCPNDTQKPWLER